MFRIGVLGLTLCGFATGGLAGCTARGALGTAGLLDVSTGPDRQSASAAPLEQVQDTINQAMRPASMTWLQAPDVHTLEDAGTNLPARADPLPTSAKGKAERLDANRFRASCPGFSLIAAEQKYDDWCWAACAQMLLQYDGERIAQDDLAEHFVKGRKVQTANTTTLMRALNPDMEGRFDGKWVADLKPRTVSSDDLLAELSAGRPVVVGLRDGKDHHAVVIHAATYRRTSGPSGAAGGILASVLPNARNAPTCAVEQVEIYDPRQKEKRDDDEKLTGGQLKGQVTFILSRALARQILSDVLERQQKRAKPDTTARPARGGAGWSGGWNIGGNAKRRK